MLVERSAAGGTSPASRVHCAPSARLPGLRTIPLGTMMGIVEKILKHVKPITQYDRTGGLYIAEMELSGFTRQGPGR